MKTLAIISSQAFSIVNFRGRLIRDLVAKSIHVYALAPDYSAELRTQVIALGATPVDISLVRASQQPWHDLLDMLRLTVMLRRLRPDIVLSYFIKPVIYGTLAAWLARVPLRVAMIEGLGYVFSATGEQLTWQRKALRAGVTLLYRLALAHAQRVIFLNRDDIHDFLRGAMLAPSKVCHIDGIGVDLSEWCMSAPLNQPITFLLVARLLREKGILEYAQAARIVKETHPEVRFLLLGDLDPNPGSLRRAELQALTHKGLLEWPGHVAVKPWLAQTSVFVLPSYREGLPRSTQEALAAGRAVITTDVAGCRETVIDGVNGFLVPAQDAAALASAMLRFISQPELIEAMGRQSRIVAQQRFDIDKINPKLIELLLPTAYDAKVMQTNRRQSEVAVEVIAQRRDKSVVISISVVSHGQMDHIVKLLSDLQEHCQGENIELILTLNIQEELLFSEEDYFFKIKIIRNNKPLGFSTNHNHAFKWAVGAFFCIINPDIRFDASPFRVLIDCLQDPKVGVVAPLVFGPSGKVEDSTRMFPTPQKILHKALIKNPERDYIFDIELFYPDWVGGMFMLLRHEVFQVMNGFDQNYFLYYEDVDLCARLKLSGYAAVLCPSSPIVHHAQRQSHRNIRYFSWHLASMLRFFVSPVYWRLKLQRRV